ncbi:DUF4177 domain-containing protein [Clostridium sp. ZS2-4]|uniref:DUF4177 domain-containing protein n=1 Tax=Clostridium sp. ZS2-4 TaxID=2987703 RepID=UPI00227D09C5|nr:DUF4177 domain-containing protein [Clostridium sp. ZS2-4]MCY6354831.1 DUF4177 domain-containing protein [Clostridium sp. ZS2-4]
MKKYEYKVVPVKIPITFSEEKRYKSLEEQLNKYGKSGWELCSLVNRLVVFKRELTK